MVHTRARLFNMKTLSYKFIYEWRYSSIVTGTFVLILLGSLNYFSGAWDAENAPWYFPSAQAFIGMTLLVTLMPAYMGATGIYGYRRSFEIAQLTDSIHGTDLTQLFTATPWKLIGTAGTVGVLFGILFNIPSQGWMNFILETPTDIVIAFGQILVWLVFFCLIALRLRIARGFNHASRSVSIDILEPTSLRPFAQNGLIDVLLFSGGLALSTVQSLDFSFRADNYTKALTIAVPVMLYLAIYPIWEIHKKMQAMKAEQLRELDERIGGASKSLEIDAMNKLEILLQRRERVSDCATWPIDIAILQRFFFYIIIPPLAWIGAALVESVIDGFIQG